MSEITEALVAAHAAGRSREAACAVARLALPIWEKKEYPGDLRPRRAIETAEREDATEKELRNASSVAAWAAVHCAISVQAAGMAAASVANMAAGVAGDVGMWPDDVAGLWMVSRIIETVVWALRAGVSPEAILDAIRIVMKVDGDSQVDCVTDWLRQHGTGSCVMIAVKPGDTVVAPAGAPVMMAGCVDVKVLSLSPTGMAAIRGAAHTPQPPARDTLAPD